MRATHEHAMQRPANLDETWRRAFADGIVWLTVGQEPDLLAIMNRLGGVLRPATPSLIQVGGPLHRMLTRGSHVISSIAIAADGSTVITASTFDKDLKVWDFESGELSCTITGYVSHRPSAFTPDGRIDTDDRP